MDIIFVNEQTSSLLKTLMLIISSFVRPSYHALARSIKVVVLQRLKNNQNRNLKNVTTHLGSVILRISFDIRPIKFTEASRGVNRGIGIAVDW